jgi:hypothetical protein
MFRCGACAMEVRGNDREVGAGLKPAPTETAGLAVVKLTLMLATAITRKW